jgi:hypothetical protein
MICFSFVSGEDEQIRHSGGHHIGPQRPDHLLPVGCLVQPPEHPACLDNSLPSAVQWLGGKIPPPPQRCAQGSTMLWTTGQTTCCGCCLACTLRPEKTTTPHPLRHSTGQPGGHRRSCHYMMTPVPSCTTSPCRWGTRQTRCL